MTKKPHRPGHHGPEHHPLQIHGQRHESATTTPPFRAAAALKLHRIPRQHGNRHAGSGRGSKHGTDPSIRGCQGRRRAATELCRAPPPERTRTCTKNDTGDSAVSTAPSAEAPQEPTLSTHVKRGSPTLPPPERPPEGEGSGGSTSRRWIERGDLKIASRATVNGRGTTSASLDLPG